MDYFPDSIKSKAYRMADVDQDSALYDIALLEICDDLLLTYRSTFSYVISMRILKRGWYIEKESPGIFQASNSQSDSISVLYHNYDFNNWQTNRRVYLNDNDEETLRYFFKYLLL